MSSGAGQVTVGLQHLLIAEQHWESYVRDYPGTAGARLLETYLKRMRWIKTDLVAQPIWPPEVREGIRQDMRADPYACVAIQERIAKLRPELREAVDELIDHLLDGESLHISYEPERDMAPDTSGAEAG